MIKILALIAPGFEEIEAVTVVDLLRRAGIEVVTVSITNEQKVTGAHNISLEADTILNTINGETFDGVFLPGGQPGTTNLKRNAGVLDLVRSFDHAGKWVTAICAAPLVLKEAGILNHRKLTSYPSEKAAFKCASYYDENIVRDGNMITSRGVGTAIDFALTLIEIFQGTASRDKLAERILWK